MKTYLRLTTLAAFAAFSGAAFAQTDPHHPATDAPQAKIAMPAAKAMPGGSPEQCTTMMSTMQQMMPMMEKMAPMMQQMMPMMQQMMQGGTPQGGGMMPGGQGGVMHGNGMMNGKSMDTPNMPEASRVYMDAMKRMDALMQGLQAGDPDVAFVQTMIPHHQGAIEMARAVLQFGKDDQVKGWANQIITAQQAELAAMQEWLKQRAK